MVLISLLSSCNGIYNFMKISVLALAYAADVHSWRDSLTGKLASAADVQSWRVPLTCRTGVCRWRAELACAADVQSWRVPRRDHATAEVTAPCSQWLPPPTLSHGDQSVPQLLMEYFLNPLIGGGRCLSLIISLFHHGADGTSFFLLLLSSLLVLYIVLRL